ncbi:hypothetical protein BCIN_15g00110 [Botrytis cinerea B05.10]|uniref:Uncharacterized protein n=1 Tax=Botryotinia fuckeliana (strain B05.10) TaxID=332648 RepID=A0A384K3R0_BOTFB|nr:hypothetical protein BCIN_15g00110 [Botrytis cinerea B05.10]ATZ57428.1 hypothetical protein BCIN_15g00110 [Botrytis cinerea B05.10]
MSKRRSCNIARWVEKIALESSIKGNNDHAVYKYWAFVDCES